MSVRPEDVQATFASTLVDEWVRCGVEAAVLAPGSRSSPLALALASHPGIGVQVHVDERSAAFLALGIALETEEPTVVLTTSGTAAAELHPAVVEADLAHVPLIVCTADRPPELRDVGAPQAIDQTHLYGRSVRWFHDPGVADDAVAPRWRGLAARAYHEATAVPGPVHLNLPFREPLLGDAGPLPPGRSGPNGGGWTWRPPDQPPVDPVITPDELAGRRGVVVAGARSGDPSWLLPAAEALGWPVLADARCSARAPQDGVVAHADGILRSAAARDVLRPEVVLRLGEAPASRVVNEWVAESGAEEIVVAGPGRWLDPSGTARVVHQVDPGALLSAWQTRLGGVTPIEAGWADLWRRCDEAAAAAIDEVLGAAGEPTEPGTARALLRALPDGSRLVVASSMPIRDLEWYGQRRRGVIVRANRGANGIDGVLSTAVGVAAGSGAPTAALIGDLAFLHDANGLLGARARGVDLTVVVLDNDGGGIFSFLPQATAVPEERFEQLFGTPHGVDLVGLASALGARAELVTGSPVRPIAGAIERGGVSVLVVPSDRHANRELHLLLSSSIAAAVDQVLGTPQ